MDWGGQVEGKCTLVLTTNSIYTTAVLTVESVLVAARHRAYMRLFCVACIMKYQQRQQLNAIVGADRLAGDPIRLYCR